MSIKKLIGKNTNSDESANVLSAISIDSTTAVDLLVAQLSTELPRIEVLVTNNGNKTLWVRKQAASIDNDKKGRRIPPGDTIPVVEKGEIYRGAISAIFDSGGANDVFVEWF